MICTCSDVCFVPRPSHISCLVHLNNIWRGYKVWKSSLRSLIQTPANCFVFCANILFSNLSQSPSANVLSLIRKTKYHTQIRSSKTDASVNKCRNPGLTKLSKVKNDSKCREKTYQLPKEGILQQSITLPEMSCVTWIFKTLYNVSKQVYI
jgi:hypothetical protein